MLGPPVAPFTLLVSWRLTHAHVQNQEDQRVAMDCVLNVLSGWKADEAPLDAVPLSARSGLMWVVSLSLSLSLSL